jgi:hypothetical protein
MEDADFSETLLRIQRATYYQGLEMSLSTYSPLCYFFDYRKPNNQYKIV